MPFRHTRSRAALPFGLLFALAACSETPAPPAAAALPSTVPDALTTTADRPRDPAPPAGLDGGAVRAFLVEQYGDLAQLQGDWPGTPLAADLGRDAAVREVCARAAIGSADAPAELVAVCGVPDLAGHATTARIDVFLLRPRGAAVTAAARQHLDGFGSTGDIVEIAVRRFGPRLYGLLIEDGFTGQGVTIGTTSVVLPDGDGFTVAATLRSSLDNLGAMAGCAERDDCAPDAALDLTFDLAIDDRDAAAAAWPLRVREHGEACGRRVDRTVEVPFDAASGTWTVPASLQRDGCD